MLPCEIEVQRPDVSSEISEGFRTVGSVSESIRRLQPDISVETANQASDFLDSIQTICEPIDSNTGAPLILRGSAGKQLVFGEVTGSPNPLGWETPQMIWNEILQGEEPPELSSLTDRSFELDITYSPRDTQDFSVMETRITDSVLELQLPVGVNFHTYAGVRLADIIWPGKSLTIQIHQLPRYEEWSTESRTSPHSSLSESFVFSFIAGRSVFVFPRDVLLCTDDRATSSFWQADQAQAVIAFQRSRLNAFWYGPASERLKQMETPCGQLPKIESYFKNPGFWKTVRETTLNHPDHMTARLNEIAVNNLLLLTINPYMLFEERNRLYWSQFLISNGRVRKDMFLNLAQYLKAFQNGTLATDQSGPAIIMKHLGLTRPSELIPFVVPR